jgi:glycosyltransferase involved in cell wall biosynthesis
MTDTKSVSIVIPVYNEAGTIADCLDAIAAQTVRPYEVIVVDNNSTDETVEIAESYHFVRVVNESRQGVVHARDTGFNMASGAIIGRIDADTIMAEDWVMTVQRIFMDPEIDAVSGRAQYHDMALSELLNAIDLRIRNYLAYMLGDEVAMQGANMAIRRSAWLDIRGRVCRSGGLHEDLDLSVHANWHGHAVRFDPSLIASLGYRQAESSYAKFAHYILLSPKTYAIHGLKSRRHMYPVCALAIICYWPLKVLHRGHDKETGRFSWPQLFAVTEQRVNPATYVE